jgi:hypothetical protein
MNDELERKAKPETKKSLMESNNKQFRRAK